VQLADSVTDFAAAEAASLWLTTAGDLYILGEIRLSSEGSVSFSTPTLLASGVDDVEAQDNSVFYHTESGAVYALGSNRYGQLGVGDTEDREQPALVVDAADEVRGGGSRSWLITDGKLYGMGLPGLTLLPEGEDGTLPVPVSTDGNEVVDVADGWYHAVYLNAEGVAFGLGGLSEGQIGAVGRVEQPYPRVVGQGVVQLAAGDGLSLYIDNEGALLGAGYAAEGALGSVDGSYASPWVHVDDDVIRIGQIWDHAIYATADGRWWGRGSNARYELGAGLTGDPTMTAAAYPAEVAMVVERTGGALWIKTDGSLWSVGTNRYGQIGDGTFEDRTTMVEIAQGVVAAAAEGQYIYYLTTAGDLYGAGNNINGELGQPYRPETPTDETGLSERYPTPVLIASGVAEMTAGGTAYLDTDGKLWTLGPGTKDLLAEDVKAIAGCYINLAYITEDGALWTHSVSLDGAAGSGLVDATFELETHRIAENAAAVDLGFYNGLFLSSSLELSDTDDDGLADALERMQYGDLSPINSVEDTDGDGFADGWEIQLTTSPEDETSFPGVDVNPDAGTVVVGPLVDSASYVLRVRTLGGGEQAIPLGGDLSTAAYAEYDFDELGLDGGAAMFLRLEVQQPQ